jgi:hypothetical protein
MRKERIPENVPGWHTACNSRCNGKRHEISRMPLSDSHADSLAAADNSRCVDPGLWRAGWFRSVTAPSLSCHCKCLAHFCFCIARRNAIVHCCGWPLHKCRCELECKRDSRWKFGSGNDWHERRLHVSCQSAGARIGHSTGHQYRG